MTGSTNHFIALIQFSAILAILVFAGCTGDAGTADPMYSEACGMDPTPNEDCYIAERDQTSTQFITARDIGLRYIAEHEPDDTEMMLWDWAQGVLMQSLVELYRLTGDNRFRDYYQSWIDAHIEKGYAIIWSDSCPPSVSALALFQENGKAEHKQVIDDVITFLFEVSKRTEKGALCHLGTLMETVWVDSLFMFGNILTRWGEYTGEIKYLDEIGLQFSLFAELLQDESGLLRHTYNWPLSTETDIFWARGNGWATAAGYEYLRARYQRNETDDAVAAIMAKQVAKLIEVQDGETGLWWNILNRPDEIYLETSGSALITYGLARGYRYGYLDENVLPVIENAVQGIESRIAWDDQNRPYVTGISGQTTAGNFSDYASVPLEEDMDFGVGAVILALIETSGLIE